MSNEEWQPAVPGHPSKIVWQRWSLILTKWSRLRSTGSIVHVVACATTCFLVPTVWKNMGLTLQIVFLFSWGYSTLQGFFKDDFGLNFKYSELPIMMNWLKNVVASPFCPTLEVWGLQGYQWWDDNQLTCTAFLPFFGGLGVGLG